MGTGAKRIYFYFTCRWINFDIKKKKAGKALLVLGVIFYYLFSITPIADLILAPLENKYQPVKIEDLNKTNTIVLLLGGKESDVLRASEALRLYNLKSEINQLKPKIIVSGGDPLNSQNKEAEEVKNYLIERGISAENIILEDKSKNTKENVENVKEIIKNEPFFLVTSAYHLPRSIETFKRVSANPIAAPADFKREENYNVSDFLPDAKILRNSDLAFHEYLGIVFYDLAY